MPIIKSAIKKLRKDKKRTAQNRVVKRKFKELIKKALAEPTLENIKLAVSAVDKATKKGVIHKNKAARVKSRLMKKAKPETKVAKKVRKKKAQAKKATVTKKKKSIKTTNRKKA